MALEQSELEELTIGLYDRGALMFSDFRWTLKSGRRSPLYYNQRGIASFAKDSRLSLDNQRRIRDLAVEAYSIGIDDLGKPYEHLYGIPQSMTPLGGMVAQLRGDSILWGRVGDQEYGVHTPIEGDFVEGDTVVDLDDVITNAASKLEAVASLGEVMLSTQGFVIMFDREEGGAEVVSDAGYDMVAINGLASAMNMLEEAGRIGAQEFEWVSQYHEQLRAD